MAPSRLERAIAASGYPVLDAEVVQRLEARHLGGFSRDAALDGIDWIAAGLGGAVAAVIDLLVVAIPKDVIYLGEHPQAGSFLTKLLKGWNVPSDNVLAEHAKASFDLVNGGERHVPGMFPGNHRFMTPGHDPLLGFIVGIHDLLRGGRTAIGTDGRVRFDANTGSPVDGLAAAFLVETLHLASDVATKAGLPAPLATLAGLLRFGSFGEKGRTLADLARYAYEVGYDLRHFLTTLSAPAASRLFLGAYFVVRRWRDEDYRLGAELSAPRGASLLAHPRLRAMVFMADAVACAANAGKIALYQGNPAAFNYGQWLATITSACGVMADQLESPPRFFWTVGARTRRRSAAGGTRFAVHSEWRRSPTLARCSSSRPP
jgi:hypothetical protein